MAEVMPERLDEIELDPRPDVLDLIAALRAAWAENAALRQRAEAAEASEDALRRALRSTLDALVAWNPYDAATHAAERALARPHTSFAEVAAARREVCEAARDAAFWVNHVEHRPRLSAALDRLARAEGSERG